MVSNCTLHNMPTAVAKALEDVAVKKALAQDEAAQWKHKYELELLRNSQLERSIASRALGNRSHCLEYCFFRTFVFGRALQFSIQGFDRPCVLLGFVLFYHYQIFLFLLFLSCVCVCVCTRMIGLLVH